MHFELATRRHAEGRHAEAAAHYRDALRLKRDWPEAWNNLGNVLEADGRLQDAIQAYGEALSLMPTYALAHYNLGNALKACGRHQDAAASYRRAIALQPDFTEAHNNLATALAQRGQLEEAVASYRAALSLNPGFAEIHHHLGLCLQRQGRPAEAAACYRHALSIKPHFAAARASLAHALIDMGEAAAALDASLQALDAEETAETRSSFTRCVSRFVADDPRIRHLLARALREAWARPSELSRPAADLIRLHARICARQPETRPDGTRPDEIPSRADEIPLDKPLPDDLLRSIVRDDLLCALLESAPVCDAELERFLTSVRAVLLAAERAGHSGLLAAYAADSPALFVFKCALARQCFINGFVFACSDQEQALAAAYGPLSDISGAESLLERDWPAPLRAVLTQQLAEPLEEARLRSTIPRLTAVDDPVSLRVRQQYEEDPYPRWIRPAPAQPAASFDAFLRERLPCGSWPDAPSPRDILIAGCGTGEEAIEMARRFPAADILAVDLSLTSLAYASRKSAELAVGNVTYAHADLLRLGDIGRSFNIVTSVGVLHHLADPAAGLRVVASLLRPGGFMRLGLYSERARAAVTSARSFIAERGYSANAAGIRACRQAMLSAEHRDRFASFCAYNDFFVMAECRDLLFHVQEHRFTLPRLSALLGEAGLEFLGFTVASPVLRGYQQRFPDDLHATDLARWDLYEAAFPDTFGGMYLFWVRKP